MGYAPLLCLDHDGAAIRWIRRASYEGVAPAEIDLPVDGAWAADAEA